MHCDCGATREDIDAGIHDPACMTRQGEIDEPADHYGQ